MRQIVADINADIAAAGGGGGITDGDKGDITVSGSGATWTIDNDVVTFAKMQNIATARILGRNTASSGDIEELDAATARTLIGAAASSHTHAISDVTSLQTTLDGKAAVSHSHIIADVTGLQSALDGKQAAGSYAAATHTHIIADVTGLQTALDAKAPLASPTFTGTVTLPAGQAVNGVTLSTAQGTSNFLRGDGSYAAPGGSAPEVYTLASDQATGANTTPVTLTGLVFTYAANSKYRIWFMGRVSPAAATTGCGFQFDLSSAVTSINVMFYHQLANTGTLSGGHSIADDASVGVSSGLPGTSTYPVTGSGLLITTSNTGTAQLRFRSETTAVITAKAGLTMVVEKIA